MIDSNQFTNKFTLRLYYKTFSPVYNHPGVRDLSDTLTLSKPWMDKRLSRYGNPTNYMMNHENIRKKMIEDNY